MRERLAQGAPYSEGGAVRCTENVLLVFEDMRPQVWHLTGRFCFSLAFFLGRNPAETCFSDAFPAPEMIVHTTIATLLMDIDRYESLSRNLSGARLKSFYCKIRNS